MKDESEEYYLSTYLKRFSQDNNFGKTIAEVPVFMSWDDQKILKTVMLLRELKLLLKNTKPLPLSIRRLNPLTQRFSQFLNFYLETMG